ncbi:hypothetical protein [Pseudohongiella acticola]|nr:hypothetical protein [Pseudohongiella acticola]
MSAPPPPLVTAFLFYFLTLIHIMPVTDAHSIEHDHANATH